MRERPTQYSAMPLTEYKMSNGEQNTTGAKKPELHMLYRPLGIKAVAAAALMLKRKVAVVKPA